MNTAVSASSIAPETPRRLMTKGRYAEYRRWKSPSQVSNLIRKGKLRPPAVRTDGLIDVELADAMLAREMDPARLSVVAASPAPAAAAGDGGETRADAAARRERALADMAELELAQRRKELVEAKGLDQLGSVAAELLWKALDERREAVVKAMRAAASVEDASRQLAAQDRRVVESFAAEAGNRAAALLAGEAVEA